MRLTVALTGIFAGALLLASCATESQMNVPVTSDRTALTALYDAAQEARAAQLAAVPSEGGISDVEGDTVDLPQDAVDGISRLVKVQRAAQQGRSSRTAFDLSLQSYLDEMQAKHPDKFHHVLRSLQGYGFDSPDIREQRITLELEQENIKAENQLWNNLYEQGISTGRISPDAPRDVAIAQTLQIKKEEEEWKRALEKRKLALETARINLDRAKFLAEEADKAASAGPGPTSPGPVGPSYLDGVSSALSTFLQGSAANRKARDAAELEGINAGAALEGTSWRATELDGQIVASDVDITLKFMPDGRAAGRAACNSYFGGYVFGQGTVSFQQMGSTKMACLKEGLMAWETTYQQLLSGDMAIERPDDQTLLLRRTDGKLLRFTSDTE